MVLHLVVVRDSSFVRNNITVNRASVCAGGSLFAVALNATNTLFEDNYSECLVAYQGAVALLIGRVENCTFAGNVVRGGAVYGVALSTGMPTRQQLRYGYYDANVLPIACGSNNRGLILVGCTFRANQHVATRDDFPSVGGAALCFARARVKPTALSLQALRSWAASVRPARLSFNGALLWTTYRIDKEVAWCEFFFSFFFFFSFVRGFSLW